MNSLYTKILKKNSRQGSGFTLVELIVSLSIILTLSSLVIPGIANYLQTGRIAETKSRLSVISLAIDKYRFINKIMPENLLLLTAGTSDTVLTRMLNVEDIKDPWNNYFYYVINYQTGYFYLWSGGPNGKNDSGPYYSFEHYVRPGNDDIGIQLHL